MPLTQRSPWPSSHALVMATSSRAPSAAARATVDLPTPPLPVTKASSTPSKTLILPLGVPRRLSHRARRLRTATGGVLSDVPAPAAPPRPDVLLRHALPPARRAARG